MNSTATACLARRCRLALIVAGLFALLGSFVAPAQADGYYGYYRSYPGSFRCGYPIHHYYNGCSRCGCGHWGCGGGGCGCGGGGCGCGGGGCGFYGFQRRSYPLYPWGYGGVRYWRSPFPNGYAPFFGYDDGQRPPWDGDY
jgi:hypothetical protein